MPPISSSIGYIFLFISLYFEVFLLITYFERRIDMKRENALVGSRIKRYPTVTIMVPCWNEAETISRTVHSLLDLNYPKDKLTIMIIDDGSTDGTWNVIQKFANKKQIKMYRKENGGKYTALNFGLSYVTSELVGCLDADSYVDKDALRNMMQYFEDKEVMAVTPSVKVWKPKTIIQLIQKVEYGWGVLTRKLLSYLGALYVTPGPFSIFRREVFEQLGGYRHAYLTEDLEMALRMQSKHYKIVNSHNSIVHTVAPNTLRKLYKQRLRWTYGFINNVFDYRHLLFRTEYGNLGFFILPLGGLSIVSAVYMVGRLVLRAINMLVDQYIKIQTVGFHINTPSFHVPNLDWFSINTELFAIGTFFALLGSFILVLISRRMTEGKVRIGLDLVYFVCLYSFIAPLWLIKATYNSLFSVKTQWR